MSVCRSAPQHGLLRRDSYSNATGSTLISSTSGLKIPGPSEREGLGGGGGECVPGAHCLLPHGGGSPLPSNLPGGVKDPQVPNDQVFLTSECLPKEGENQVK